MLAASRSAQDDMLALDFMRWLDDFQSVGPPRIIFEEGLSGTWLPTAFFPQITDLSQSLLNIMGDGP